MRTIEIAACSLAAWVLLIQIGTAQISAVVEEAALDAGPLTADPRDRFGTTSAIDRNTIVVGAPEEEPQGEHDGFDSGAVYVYERFAGSWTQVAKFVGDETQSENFGRAVDVDGDRIVVGANVRVDGVTGAGAAYVFRRTGTGWIQEAMLREQTPETNDFFGDAVAVSGDTILIGIPGDDDRAPNAGSASVFVRSGTTWNYQARLVGSLSSSSESLGRRIVLEGDVAILHDGVFGKAFLYERKGGVWNEELALSSGGSGASLARAAATTGEWAFFSNDLALFDDSVHVYRRESSGWSFQGDLPVQDPGGVWGVEAMSADGFLLAVGVREEAFTGGQVELFLLRQDAWESIGVFQASDTVPWDRFAWSLGLSEGRVVVGAPFHDEYCPPFEPDCQSGAAYVFEVQDGAPSFCDAIDGSLAACPCLPGHPESGCEIAGFTGGVRLDVVSADSTPQNRAVLVGSGYPQTAAPASIVLRSSTLESAPVAFGDGLRCVGAPLVRLGAAFALGGTSTHTFGHGTAAGSGPFYYQLWFRSAPAMYCTSGAFNVSNGRRIDW